MTVTSASYRLSNPIRPTALIVLGVLIVCTFSFVTDDAGLKNYL